MTIKYHILLRAYGKTELVHQVKRPFALSKLQTIKLCFYSLKNARFPVIQSMRWWALVCLFTYLLLSLYISNEIFML